MNAGLALSVYLSSRQDEFSTEEPTSDPTINLFILFLKEVDLLNF